MTDPHCHPLFHPVADDHTDRSGQAERAPAPRRPFPALPEAEYPPTVGAAFVVDLVMTLHGAEDDRAADLEDGDLLARVGQFDQYVLAALPLATVDLEEFTVDATRAAAYAARATPLPPVVYDPEARSMIDGLHRAVGAHGRGDTAIWAYVGVSRRQGAQSECEDAPSAAASAAHA